MADRSPSAPEPAGSTLFFKPASGDMWDSWVYFRDGLYHLYYLIKAGSIYDGIGLALSPDGVRWTDHGRVIDKSADATWLGSGAVWPLTDATADRERFVMNFSEWRGDTKTGRQTIFFALSDDLINWRRLADFEFCQDERFYRSNGRWDNIWPVRSPDGRYHGYWAATPRGGEVGLGFGESDDGLSWRALAPALLTGVSPGPPNVHSPEVGAVQFWDDQYYALVGLDDLAPLANEDFTDFRPGHTTFVSRSAAGPFSPATRNRRLLVGNASYFTRFVAAGDGVLVNHHSWEICAGKMLDVGDRTSCMAPLKRAEWDGEGVLRLRWWAANEIAKEEAIELQPALGHTAFHIGRTLILEAVMALSPEPSGLFLQGSGESGIGFVVHENGLCQYGDINPDGSNFRPAGSVDRELELGGRVSLRLIRKNRITEFYLNDYLMQCFCLPEPGTGRISLIGPGEQFYEIRAWYSA